MIKITRLQSPRDVFDITVEDNHNFYANEILVSNCVEVNHAITPLKAINDPESEIGVCVLSAINWMEITSDEDFERVCDAEVRMLDEIIDIQDYFDTAAQNFCQNKRSIGIGITNLAAFLAKHKLAYTSPEALPLIDEWMEKQQYYLIKASVNLAKEKGPCSKFHTSKYSKGFLPIDKVFKDQITDRKPSMDWEALRAEIAIHGMRHTTLTCQMPCESCLKYDTKIKTVDGWFDFHEICQIGNVNWENIEKNNLIGWYRLDKPVCVETKDGIFEVNDIYYNGFKNTTEIEMEDGTIFHATENHKFLTENGWKKVSELTEEDEILQII